MAGGSEAAEEAKLSGLSKIFNAQTTRGRADVSLLHNRGGLRNLALFRKN